ncbi:MAG TPA: hypothetical protein VH419_16365 [Nocardioidaceae bacterium]|jgi:hypothetical protein
MHARTWGSGLGLPEALLLVLPAVVFLAVVIRRAWVSDTAVERWCVASGLQTSGESSRLARKFLETSRRFRACGAVLGFLVAISWEYAFGAAHIGWELPLALIGYLLGAVAAETGANRPLRRPKEVARLVPRRVEDYVPPSLLRTQRVLGVAAFVVALVYASYTHSLASQWLPGQLAAFSRAYLLGSSLGLVPFGLLGLCVLALIEWAERSIVARPQPAMDAERRALDDAMRATSARSIAGGGMALLLALVAIEVMVCAAGLDQPPSLARYLVAAVAAALWLGSLVLWLRLSEPHAPESTRGMPPGLAA